MLPFPVMFAELVGGRNEIADFSIIFQHSYHRVREKSRVFSAADFLDQVFPAIHNFFFRITFLHDASGIPQFSTKAGV